MMGLVNNFDGQVWRAKEMTQFLANPAARQKLTQGLLQYAQLEHQAGIVLDLEDIPDSSQRHFQKFVSEAGAGVHTAGLKLIVALAPPNPSYGHVYLAQHFDGPVLMNYDHH